MNDHADGALYPARVMHRRRVAPHYRFVYRVFYLLIDIDRVDALAARLRCFSHNGFNLFALHDRDHGDGRGLRAWAEHTLRSQGIEPDGGRIRLLAFPRVLGFAFNPIALWYCEHRDGRLQAIIAEVRNTFGERHSYVLASSDASSAYGMTFEKDKHFHVSPFLERSGRYRFVLDAPGERVRVVIHETREGRPVLDATLAGERRELNDRTIIGQLLRMPWMTVKVVAGIHWEALKIWLRGAKFHTKPEPLQPDVS
ncbi:DUF1365 domain-containing protein [Fontimonas sp. SYSU GA230001]|uniref:DUF1365 domain-containing protein n=1 Tax=Fontimonas sp. SYSU GA230001 TaxID=3142450 RepID=UPI0032B57349